MAGWFVKGILLFFTLILWMAGAALLGLSGWLMVRDFEFKGLTGNQIVDIGFMTVAGVIFLVGFIGCCGVVFEKVLLLKIYVVSISIFVLAELAIAIYIPLQAEQLEKLMKKNWDALNDKTRISIQEKLICCGVEPVDYTHGSSNHSSCFGNKKRYISCFDRIKLIIENNMIVVASSAGGFVLIEIIIIICSCIYITRLQDLTTQTKVYPMQAYPGNRYPGRGPPPRRPPVHQQTMPMEVEEYEDYDEVNTRKGTRDRWAKHDSRHYWKHK